MIRRWISPLKDLGVQLLSLYLLIIIPALMILFAFDKLAGQRIQADVRANDLSLARTIALETDLSINKSLQAVTHFPYIPAFSLPTLRRWEKYSTSFSKPVQT